MTKEAELYFLEGCGRCSLGGTLACKIHRWAQELVQLRAIVLECGLKEECKWGVPCYTFEGKNILLLSALMDYCSIDFFKGALLSDEKGILVRQTENIQASRQVRFMNLETVLELENTLKAYIFEAIEVEKIGLKVPRKSVAEYPIPVELQQKMAEMPALQVAFETLTPGRQKGYLLHFAAAKQSATRAARIEKWLPTILAGRGMHD